MDHAKHGKKMPMKAPPKGMPPKKIHANSIPQLLSGGVP